MGAGRAAGPAADAGAGDEGRPAEAPPDAPSARHIVTQMKWLGAGEAVGQAAWYVMVLVLAAVVSPRAFGTVAAGMAIVRVANMITMAGTGGSIIAAKDVTGADVHAALRRTLTGALLFTVVIALAGGVVARVFAGGGDPTVLRVLSLSVTLAALTVVPQALLKKALDFKRVSLISAAAAVVTSVVAVAVALLGAGVWSLVVRQLLYEILLALLLWRAARRVIPSLLARPVDGRRGRPPANRLSFLIISASGLFAMTLDNMVVGATLDARHLGYYSLAFAIAFAPLTQISWRFGSVLFPAVAATRDLAVVGRRTVSILRVTSLVIFPLVPIAAVLSPVLVRTVLGAKWMPMVGPLQILLAVGAAHAITNVIGESLSGTGNVRRRAWWDASWAILTLSSVAVLAHFHGIDGAAAAHLIGYVPLLAGYVLVGSRLVGTSPQELWAGMRPLLLALGAQSVVTFVVVRALGGSSHAAAAVTAAIAGLVASALVLRLAPSRPLGELAAVGRLVRSRQAPAAAGA